MGEQKQDINIFDWLESLFPDWQISPNHQRFLNLICAWKGGIQTHTKMSSIGWEKVYKNWLAGRMKPDEITPEWECLPIG